MIYKRWAFDSLAQDMAANNMDELKKLQDKYKIHYGLSEYNPEKESFEYINQDDYDIVYYITAHGYGYNEYYITKNKPNLSKDELALICDGGNLCFGYADYGNTIKIYTD